MLLRYTQMHNLNDLALSEFFQRVVKNYKKMFSLSPMPAPFGLIFNNKIQFLFFS